MGSASLAAARPPARPPGPWRQYKNGINSLAPEPLIDVAAILEE